MADTSTQEKGIDQNLQGIIELRKELGDSGGWDPKALGAIEANERLQEATEQVRELEHKVATDTLTQLLSKEQLNTELKKLEQKEFAALFIDIDNFKPINDKFGHLIGDEILEILGKRILSHVAVKTSSDIVGRFGGEEFLGVLVDVNDLEKAKNRAEQIRESVASEPFKLKDGKSIPVTVSVGVAIRKPEDTVLDVVNRADKAMYKAKEAGRNQIATEKEIIKQPKETKELSNA